MSLAQVVTAVGIIAGIALLITAIKVFWGQREAPAGSVAAVVGLILIGMSQWSTIKIKGAGLEVDISQIASAVDKVAEEAVTNAAAVETTRQQLLTLSRQLENNQTLSVTNARALRDSLNKVPAADTVAVNRARIDLRTAVGNDFRSFRNN
jgi:hypothetical protein